MDHHGQQFTCLLSLACKLFLRDQATPTSHLREKFSLNNMFSYSGFCQLSSLGRQGGVCRIVSHEADHAAAVEVKTTFAPCRIIWSSPRSSIPWQNHSIRKFLLLHRCTLGFLCTFIIHFADDPEHCDWKRRVSSRLRPRKALFSQITDVSVQGPCSSTIYFHNSWKDCL